MQIQSKAFNSQGSIAFFGHPMYLSFTGKVGVFSQQRKTATFPAHSLKKMYSDLQDFKNQLKSNYQINKYNDCQSSYCEI